MPPPGARAWSCGAAPLLLMLLVLPLAAAAAAAWHLADDAERRTAQRMETGRVFGGWMLALHRATQESRATWPADLSAARPTYTATQVRAFGGAPPGLPVDPGRGAAMVFGVLDDDPGAVPDTPMAWAVIEFGDAADVGPAALGASAFGLAGMVVRTGGTDSDSPVAAHLARIEGALGRAIGQHALIATADHGVPYHASALYRRAQPGRPWLNRMDQALLLTDGDGNVWNLEAGAALAARETALAGRAEANGTTSPSRVDADLLVGVAAAPAALEARGPLSAALAAAECQQAGGTPVTGDCVTARAGPGEPPVTVSAGQALLGDRLTAARVELDGRLEAAQTRNLDTVSAAIVAAGDRASAGTRITAATALVAGEFEVSGPLAVAGAASAATLQTGSLDAATARGGSVGADSAFGPSAAVSGLMTVGSCDGCDWDGSP